MCRARRYYKLFLRRHKSNFTISTKKHDKLITVKIRYLFQKYCMYLYYPSKPSEIRNKLCKECNTRRYKLSQTDNQTPYCKIQFARFLAQAKILDGAECESKFNISFNILSVQYSVQYSVLYWVQYQVQHWAEYWVEYWAQQWVEYWVKY